MVGETTELPLYRDHRAPTVRSPDSLAPSPPPPLNTPPPPPPTIGTVESAPVSSGACTKGIMTFPRSATTKGDQQWGGGRRTLIRQRPTSSERLHRPSEPRESRTKPCLDQALSGCQAQVDSAHRGLSRSLHLHTARGLPGCRRQYCDGL